MKTSTLFILIISLCAVCYGVGLWIGKINSKPIDYETLLAPMVRMEILRMVKAESLRQLSKPSRRRND